MRTNAMNAVLGLHRALTRRGLLPVAGVALTFAALIDVAAQPGVRRFPSQTPRACARTTSPFHPPRWGAGRVSA